LSHDLASRKKQAGVLLPQAERLGFAEHRERLESFISENHNATALILSNLAKVGGLQVIYDGLYRHLSHHAAHPSISAADSFLVQPPDDEAHAEFRFDPDGTSDALHWTCHALLIACATFEKACGTTPEVNSELAACLADFEALDSKRREARMD
jgi:hypothetical protein